MNVNKNNRLIKGLKEIQKISAADNCEVDTAAIKYAQKHGFFGDGKYPQEMNELRSVIRYYIQHPTKTLADMFKEI